jgi:Rad3-related DNA helicase
MFHTPENRERVVDLFLADPNDNSVLVSPSMTDGLSLDDDLARFQIVCKIPFPFLGDPQIAAKKDRNQLWYDLETAKTLVQSFGRAVRSDDDHAVTYILDQDFERFYARVKDRMFPSYIQEAIAWE